MQGFIILINTIYIGGGVHPISGGIGCMYRCMQVNYGGCMLHATIGNEGDVVPAQSVVKGYMRGIN